MKRYLIIILFYLFQYTHLNAQLIYQRAFYGMSLLFMKGNNTSDRGFIMMSRKNTSVNNDDLFLIKLDANGDTAWTKTYLYSSSDEIGDVRQTKDGGFIIVGSQYIIKTDSIGNPQWSKTISLWGISQGCTVAETQSGDLVIASRGRISSWNTQGIHLTKFDSSGIEIFNKVIGVFTNPYPYEIKITNDGGLIIAGETDRNGATNDGFLMRTDSAGNPLWAHHYGSNAREGFLSVEQTNNGDFIAIGRAQSPQETFMIKVDSSGVLMWSRIYHSTSAYSEGYMITKTSDQNFVFCGRIQSPHSSILGKINENGTVLWAKAYRPGIVSNASSFNGVYEAADKCLIATGFYVEVPWVGFNYIVKCDSSGNSNCFSSDISWSWIPFSSKDSAITTVVANGSSSTTVVPTECFCDSTNFICTGYVGMNELNSLAVDLSIYPNPFFEVLNIEINNSEISEVILYDINSRVLIQQKYSNRVTLNTKHLPKGIYIYEIRNKFMLTKRGKIIKD